MTHCDSTFLIDLLREEGRGRPGAAMEFLAGSPAMSLAASVHVLCELLAGAEGSNRRQDELARIERVTGAISIIYPDDRFAPVYGRLAADLARRGKRVGAMDLLIATAAVVAEVPLLTRNARHFSLIAGLQLATY